MPDFEPPAVSRQDIVLFGSAKAPTSLSEKIYEAAKDRFAKTLEKLNAAALLVSLEQSQTVTDKTAQQLLPDEQDRQHLLEESAREELADPLVQEFLQKLVGAKVYANSYFDSFLADQKTFDHNTIAQRKHDFHTQFPSLAQKTYAELQHPHAKRITEIQILYPGIEDYEHDDHPAYTEQILREYMNLLTDDQDYIHQTYFLDQINIPAYIALAEHIATRCAHNSYLEALFATFADEKIKVSLQLDHQVQSPVHVPLGFEPTDSSVDEEPPILLARDPFTPTEPAHTPTGEKRFREVRPYVRYFESQPNETLPLFQKFRAIADLHINTQGYAIYTAAPLNPEGTQYEQFICPDGLSSLKITPRTYQADTHVVYNPEVVEIRKIHAKDYAHTPVSIHEEDAQLKQNGWVILDSTMETRIYVRQKAGVPPVAIPDDIQKNEALMHYLPAGQNHLA